MSKTSPRIKSKSKFLVNAQEEEEDDDDDDEDERQQKILYIFDFDYTIVMRNSEQIYKGVVARKKGVLESELENPPPPLHWDHMCQGLVNYVLEDCGVSIQELLQGVTEIPFVPGMDKVLATVAASVLKNNETTQLIILSGANNLFIRTKLATLSPKIVPDEIISNRATVVKGRSFKYSTHSNQRSCSLCCHALCKGAELESYFESQGRFHQLHFICDGTNDMCPSLRLREQDTVYVRSGFGMEGLIKKTKEGECPIRANIVYWNDGHDLLRKLLPEPEPEID